MATQVERTHFERSKAVGAVEWPTLILAAVIYGGWLGLTYFHSAIPIYVTIPLCIWLVAWHGSLQHEVIHSHPTRHRTLNDTIGFPPLSLWLPYQIYRKDHLTHHHDARLTDPIDDPESRYWTIDSWRSLGVSGRFLLNLQSVLLGRLILGPAWSVSYFFVSEAKRIARGDLARLRIWTAHGVGVVIILYWLRAVCHFSLVEYVFGIVYPAISLLQVRSFAEHRAATQAAHRTAIVENAPILGLLYLYNNLHIVHHSFAQVPWYHIPGYYRSHRAAFIERNGGLLYDGYGDVFRRFFVKPHDQRLHPSDRVPHDAPAAGAEVFAASSQP